ncbi:MAG: flippase-like domain-containing protein [Sphingobacteriales bacterium]|nr:MAG: flippase-like domain-containing protein [Sphingobacteriales bacterium]
MTKKTFITILQYVTFLGLGIAIIFYMFGKLSEQEKEEMLVAIKSVRTAYLFPILVIGFLSHWFRALRWKLMLEPLHIRPSTTNTTFAVMIGYLANLVLPRAGEVAKCTVLARYEKVPADKMIGTIVAERIFDLICLVTVTAFAFTMEASVIGKFAEEKIGKISEKTHIFIILIIAFILGIVSLGLIYRRYKETRAGRFIRGLGAGLQSIIKMKKRWQFLGYTVLIWSMYLTLLIIGFRAMPATEHLSIMTGLVVLVFGSVGMITTQGGIGAYTYLVAETLRFYNIEEAHGQAFGWLSWGVQTGIVLILGVATLILLPIYNRKPKHAQAGLDKE